MSMIVDCALETDADVVNRASGSVAFFRKRSFVNGGLDEQVFAQIVRWHEIAFIRLNKGDDTLVQLNSDGVFTVVGGELLDEVVTEDPWGLVLDLERMLDELSTKIEGDKAEAEAARVAARAEKAAKKQAEANARREAARQAAQERHS